MLREEEAALWTGSADDQPPELDAAAPVQGGRERGLILHKLMEEVLTGETQEAEAALAERAAELIRALGQSPVADPATGLSAQELAACVVTNPGPAGHRGFAAGPSGRISRLCRTGGRWRGNRNGRDRRCPDPWRPRAARPWSSTGKAM